MQLHNLLTKKEPGLVRPEQQSPSVFMKSNSAAMATTATLTKKSKSKPLDVNFGGENLVKEIQAMIIS